jgi:hypothetical protein
MLNFLGLTASYEFSKEPDAIILTITNSMFIYFYLILLFFFITKWPYQAPIFLGCYFSDVGILGTYATLNKENWYAAFVGCFFPVLLFAISYAMERYSLKIFL